MDKIKMEVLAVANSLLKLIDTKEGAGENPEPANRGYSIKEELEYERQKYLDDRFNILFAGEIKTGKSSLVNNLLGMDVCTVAPGVCTNVNTVIRYGRKETITVHFNPDEDGSVPEPQTISRQDISEYVSEKSNKNNKRNVRIIDVEEPLDILKEGETFIDTPGLGSLNPYHAATTFSMAPMADVIVLVSHRDLTTDERDYILRLLSASRCAAVIHVLTNSDSGDPQTTLRENDKHLRKIAKKKGVSYLSCSVSNTLYEKIRKGESIQIEDTGFDVLIKMIDSLRMASRRIKTERLLSVCRGIIAGYIYEDRILLDAIDNPELAKKRKDELNAIMARLKEIESKSDEWKIKLGTKTATYKNHVDAEVRAHFDQVRTVIEEKLQDKDYIKHPDKLGALVSSEIVSKAASLERLINEDLHKVYKDLCDETGLTLACDGLDPIEKPSGEIKLDKPEVDRASIYRNAIVSRIFIGTVFGGIAGAIIGTFITPGAGTLAGAAAGAELGAKVSSAVMAVWGTIKVVFVGEEKVLQLKRDKIMSKIKPIIAEKQSSYLINVKDVISNAEEQLRITFSRALKSLMITCKEQLQKITDADNGDKSKCESLKAEIRYLEKLDGILSSIQKSLYEG